MQFTEQKKYAEKKKLVTIAEWNIFLKITCFISKH